MVSPEEFDHLWDHMLAHYLSVRDYYLHVELYECHEYWAWPWEALVSFKFTGGIRTNGRVESENRVNKAFGPKKKLQATV